MAERADKIPVLVYTRGRPGPDIAIVGGIHGNEFYGPAAILSLRNQLRAALVSGTVRLVPAANLAAVVERSRSAAGARGDMNRQFGTTARNSSEKLFYVAQDLWNEHLAGCDVLVDLHSGGRCELLPHVRFSGAEESVLPLVGALGIKYGMKYGSLPPGLLISRARHDGAVSLGVELGAEHRVESRTLESLVKGLVNLLRFIGTLKGPYITSPLPILVRPGEKRRSGVEGFFFPTVSVGRHVKEGEELGVFTSLQSLRSRKVYAWTSGLLFTLLTAGPARKGEKLAEIVPEAEQSQERTTLPAGNVTKDRWNPSP